MLLSDVKVGKPIEIHINREGYRYRLVSKVEEVNKNSLYVSLIATRTRIFQFEKSDRIEMIYRMDDRLWKWKGVKGGIARLDGEMVHCLMSDREGEPYNRRNAYRVFMGTEFPLYYYTLKEGISKEKAEKMKRERNNINEEELYDVKRTSCLLKDLSENGIGIFCNEIFEPGTELSLSIPSSYGTFHIRASVIRNTNDRYELYRYFYGCSIIQAEKKLTKYLFDLQRKQLHKRRNEKNG